MFTDPPFGGNIPYAEVNFINEAWLGRLTNRADEVIISDSQGKTSVEYADNADPSINRGEPNIEAWRKSYADFPFGFVGGPGTRFNPHIRVPASE